MSIENKKINPLSTEAKTSSERFSMRKKRGQAILLGTTAVGMLLGYVGHGAVDSIVDSAQKILSERNTVEESGEQAINLIKVVAESGDSVIKLCQENVAYKEGDEPNWNEFAYRVENLEPNVPLFEDGRTLQEGDILSIPPLDKESADK